MGLSLAKRLLHRKRPRRQRPLLLPQKQSHKLTCKQQHHNSKKDERTKTSNKSMQLKDKTNDKLFHQIADYWVYTYELSDCDETEEY